MVSCPGSFVHEMSAGMAAQEGAFFFFVEVFGGGKFVGLFSRVDAEICGRIFSVARAAFYVKARMMVDYGQDWGDFISAHCHEGQDGIRLPKKQATNDFSGSEPPRMRSGA